MDMNYNLVYDLAPAPPQGQSSLWTPFNIQAAAYSINVRPAGLGSFVIRSFCPGPGT